jgi:hypothetical protein
MPRQDGKWNPHSSYHRDGRFHMKSFGRKFEPAQKRQPLTGVFKGTEHLGSFGGHFPKTLGAKCDPKDFTGVIEVLPELLDLNTAQWSGPTVANQRNGSAGLQTRSNSLPLLVAISCGLKNSVAISVQKSDSDSVCLGSNPSSSATPISPRRITPSAAPA